MVSLANRPQLTQQCQFIYKPSLSSPGQQYLETRMLHTASSSAAAQQQRGAFEWLLAQDDMIEALTTCCQSWDAQQQGGLQLAMKA